MSQESVNEFLRLRKTNQLKIEIFSKVIQLREKFYLVFSESIYFCTLTWYHNCKEGDDLEDKEHYSVRATCEHELRDMSRFLDDLWQCNTLPHFDFNFDCNHRCPNISNEDSPF